MESPRSHAMDCIQDALRDELGADSLHVDHGPPPGRRIHGRTARQDPKRPLPVYIHARKVGGAASPPSRVASFPPGSLGSHHARGLAGLMMVFRPPEITFGSRPRTISPLPCRAENAQQAKQGKCCYSALRSTPSGLDRYYFPVRTSSPGLTGNSSSLRQTFLSWCKVSPTLPAGGKPVGFWI